MRLQYRQTHCILSHENLEMYSTKIMDWCNKATNNA